MSSPSPPSPSSPSPPSTLTPAPIARWRAHTLLLIFSMAQLLDIWNVTAPTVGLPDIADDLGITYAERQWAINAYGLTFGAFLLTGGRFSAIWGAKPLFLVGFSTVGICAIVVGFSVNAPMMFVIRALQGIGAALSIPSAISMICVLYPIHREQDRALGIFAGFGAMGNVTGLVLGGVISQLLTWRWIFYICSMLILPLCLLAFILAPPTPPESDVRKIVQLRRLDWLGLGTITLSLILFVYSITEGNNRGWASGGILAPLIISIFLVPLFLFIETKVEEPLVPPIVWKLKGFLVLFAITLSEYMAMNVVIFQEAQAFQSVWGTSAISAAVRIIPFGITGFITTISSGYITAYVPPRPILVVGQLCMMAGALLCAYGDTKARYWDRVLPGVILEALGVASGFVAANIAMLRTPFTMKEKDLPLSIATLTPLIGAIFNADLQIGSALGLSVTTAITARVNGDNNASFAGYRAAYWFIVALCALEAVLALVGLKDVRTPSSGDEEAETRVQNEEGEKEKESEKVVEGERDVV